jgi:hypothetical protein
MLSENAINARARVYTGPRKIKYGMSINGEGPWKNIGDCLYDETEHNVVLDDVLYIFHKNTIQNNAFEKIPTSTETQNEWLHARIFNERKIQFNVIGIHLCFTRHNSFSGHINMD